jgi:hypothetical protein
MRPPSTVPSFQSRFVELVCRRVVCVRVIGCAADYLCLRRVSVVCAVSASFATEDYGSFRVLIRSGTGTGDPTWMGTCSHVF